jgi:hypothetical protein
MARSSVPVTVTGSAIPTWRARRVRGHEGPGGEEHDVSRHDVFERDLPFLPVAQDPRAHGDPGEELAHGVRGSPFLPEAQKAAGDEDDEDDDRVLLLAHDEGQDGGDGQQEHQRARELAQQEL